MKQKISKQLKLIGRVALSGAILLYLISKIDFAAAKDSLSTLHLGYLALALVPSVVELILKSLKWQMLLRIKNIRVPFYEIFKIYYISSFIGTFLPSSLGIDVLRSYSMSRFIRNAQESVSTVFVDRLLGVLSLIFVVLLGVLSVQTGLINNIWQFVLTIVGVIFILFTGLILSRHLIVLLEKILKQFRIKPEKIRKYIDLLHNIYNSIIDFKNNKVQVFKVFLVSIVFQFSRIAITWCVGLSFGIDLSIKYWIIIVPLVTLATMLPLAVGGIGIREGAFVFFLNKMGVPIETGFLLSITVFLLAVFTAIPGFGFYLRYGINTSRDNNTDFKNGPNVQQN